MQRAANIIHAARDVPNGNIPPLRGLLPDCDRTAALAAKPDTDR